MVRNVDAYKIETVYYLTMNEVTFPSLYYLTMNEVTFPSHALTQVSFFLFRLYLIHSFYVSLC